MKPKNKHFVMVEADTRQELEAKVNYYMAQGYIFIEPPYKTGTEFFVSWCAPMGRDGPTVSRRRKK